jgi:hypothetical protein
MDVSYLLVELERNYPPLPLVTHPFLCTGLILFLPTPDRAPSHPVTPCPFSTRGSRAAHPLPPSLPYGELPMAGSGRSGPPRPPTPPSSSESMGKAAPRLGCLVSFGARPLELLLSASLTAACPIRPACLESPPTACPLRQPRPFFARPTHRLPRPTTSPPWSPPNSLTRPASRLPWPLVVLRHSSK